MKIIVGLGNPGLRYRQTRHNLGFMVVNRVAEERGLRFRRGRFKSTQAEGEIGKEQVLLVRPMTFMNLSGVCVASVVREQGCEPSQVLVVCDDVNLDLGKLRLRRSGTAGGHKGLESVIQQLRNQQFPRLRVGIGQPPAGMEMMRYVLSPFRREERLIAGETIERAAQAVETWVCYGIDEAMNRFN
jgi:PTH1 family peptidyl-tRNA hydrolase